VETLAPMDLFDHVIRLLQPQAAQRKVQVMRELTLSQDLQIKGDKALLQQALYNLIENAIKYSPVNGQVFLRLQPFEEKVIFEIQDQGPGIAPLDIPKIFERGNAPGRNQDMVLRSSGLGLTIVKTIAERHGGRTWVKSVLGKGSTFFLEIPLRQDKTE
jgi:signal transduction histidine kinase